MTMIMKSKLTKRQLAERWDERTSPQRFAGSDDMFDNIFVADRKGDKIKVAFKPRTGTYLFSAVFRGRITEDEEGSAITGKYTKSDADYVIAGILVIIFTAVLKALYDRGIGAIKIYIGMLICAAVLFVFLVPKRGAIKKYRELFKDITQNG